MIQGLRIIWERLALYFPVLLMVILALGTYWLVRSTPQPVLPGQEAPVSHEPDYFMRNFSVKTFDAAGRLKSEVFGAAARHFPDTDALEIDAIRIHSFSEEGRLTTATAVRGVANGDGSEVQLIGNAQVVRDAGLDKAGLAQSKLTYRSEFLHAFLDTERVKSHQPVELVQGSDRFTADTMDFDNLGRVMLLEGRVKSTLTPAASR